MRNSAATFWCTSFAEPSRSLLDHPLEPRIAAQRREDRIDAQPGGRYIPWSSQNGFDDVERAIVLSGLNTNARDLVLVIRPIDRIERPPQCERALTGLHGFVPLPGQRQRTT